VDPPGHTSTGCICRISRPLDVELYLKLRFATSQTKIATLKGLYELAALELGPPGPY